MKVRSHQSVLLGSFLFPAFHRQPFHLHFRQLFVLELLDKLVQKTSETVNAHHDRERHVQTIGAHTHVQHILKPRHQLRIAVLNATLQTQTHKT